MSTWNTIKNSSHQSQIEATTTNDWLQSSPSKSEVLNRWLSVRVPGWSRYSRQFPWIKPFTTSANYRNTHYSDRLHCHWNCDFFVMGKLEYCRRSVFLFRHIIDNRLRRYGSTENVPWSGHSAVCLLRLSASRTCPRRNVL